MRHKGQIDYLILFLVIALAVIGIIVLASASSDLAKAKLNDVSYYLNHQIIYGLGLGILGFLAGILIPYQKYKRFAPFLLLLGVSLLILTFTPLGTNLNSGATRWLQFGPITVQPAELLKLFFIIYLAAVFSSERHNRQADFWKGFMPFAIVSGTITALLLLQRSTSAVVIIMLSGLAVYFVSGAKKRYIAYIFGFGALALGILILFSPYRLERITTFLNPSADTSGSGYQVERAKISIGSGGWTGVGYGNSLSKNYLPERIGDSIFAILAEEFGFIGAAIVIAMFLFLVVRGYLLAKYVRDPFGKLILTGFSTIIGLQAFMHMAAISGIIPLTGVPLPFISYGGTALAVFMAMSGIMLNISKNK